jgi:hypothetical protein
MHISSMGKKWEEGRPRFCYVAWQDIMSVGGTVLYSFIKLSLGSVSKDVEIHANNLFQRKSA